MKKSPPRRVFRLSENEVRALQSILGKIGGSPSKSARSYIDAVRIRLEETFGELQRFPIESDASIHFADGL